MKTLSIVSWMLLPTVMYGGYSLLSLLRRNKLTVEQITLFRAGHAHAGVLLVLSLVYHVYLAATQLPHSAQVGASAALLAGILLQSGGFFWHAFVDRNGAIAGVRMTQTGAVLLAGAVIVLVCGLIGAA
jgi:hypothetical protein